jgi:hypothetical protein
LRIVSRANPSSVRWITSDFVRACRVVVVGDGCVARRDLTGDNRPCIGACVPVFSALKFRDPRVRQQCARIGASVADASAVNAVLPAATRAAIESVPMIFTDSTNPSRKKVAGREPERAQLAGVDARLSSFR